MARRVSGPVIIGGVLILLIVVGGIFLLIGLITGDKTKNQEHAAPTTSVIRMVDAHAVRATDASGAAAGR